MSIRRPIWTWLSIIATAAFIGLASAAEKAMTGVELKALLSAGKTITLGGPGEGYLGSLTLSADGSGSGSAKTDEGRVLTLTGTWKIKGDTFCRQWEEFDNGKEVCEIWVLTTPTKVNVMVNDTKVGVNSW
jgi:hypothetical protein